MMFENHGFFIQGSQPCGEEEPIATMIIDSGTGPEDSMTDHPYQRFHVHCRSILPL